MIWRYVRGREGGGRGVTYGLLAVPGGGFGVFVWEEVPVVVLASVYGDAVSGLGVVVGLVGGHCGWMKVLFA